MFTDNKPYEGIVNKKPYAMFESANQQPSEFEDWYHQVSKWGRDRGIVQNSTAYAQSIKTREETEELIVAADKLGNARTDAEWIAAQAEYIDAVGDIIVTLVMGCEIQGIDMQKAMWAAYDQIKDRKGYLNESGVFIKDV